MKRKAVSGLLALSMVMTLASGVTPVLAADSTQETTQVGSPSATINYEQGSTFTVTIPKAIELSSDKSAEYTVKVQGDIAGNESVTVTPDASVTLNDSDGKAAVTGNITQTKTDFAATEVNLENGAETTGNILAEDLTAGNWSGSFDFVIGIDKDEIGEELQAGLYDEDGNLLCTWEDSGIDAQKSYQNADAVMSDSKSLYNIQTQIYDESNKRVKMVILPDNIQKIGSYAFRLGPFEKIKISNSVNVIWNSAFYQCRSLKHIVIPDSVTEIKWTAFQDCSRLERVDMGSNLEKIGANAFRSCTNLKCVNIPNSIKSIDVYAFGDCKNLASVTYKEQIYTSKSVLIEALQNDNVTVGDGVFYNTALTD